MSFDQMKQVIDQIGPRAAAVYAYLISRCVTEPQTVVLAGQHVQLWPMQCAISLRHAGKELGWSKDTTSKIIAVLENFRLISVKNETKYSRITILNSNRQSAGSDNATQPLTTPSSYVQNQKSGIDSDKTPSTVTRQSVDSDFIGENGTAKDSDKTVARQVYINNICNQKLSAKSVQFLKDAINGVPHHDN